MLPTSASKAAGALRQHLVTHDDLQAAANLMNVIECFQMTNTDVVWLEGLRKILFRLQVAETPSDEGWDILPEEELGTTRLQEPVHPSHKVMQQEIASGLVFLTRACFEDRPEGTWLSDCIKDWIIQSFLIENL